MAESRYNRLDNQSPIQSQLQNEDLKIPSSAFDYSCIHSGNAIIGALIPVDCFDVIPGEHISISMANLLEFRNPTTRQLLNSFRVYFHGYYNRFTDLWEGAQNFLDTGLSGSLSLTRPKLIYKVHSIAPSKSGVTPTVGSYYIEEVNACTPLSLLNYLGLPAEAYNPVKTENNKVVSTPLDWFKPAISVRKIKTATSATVYTEDIITSLTSLSAHADYFPADCAFAYQRNWRDFYCNRNLLSNNKYWFPDNEHHFVLSYECEEAVCINYGNEDFSSDVATRDVSRSQGFNITGFMNTSFTDNNVLTAYNAQTNEPSCPSSTPDTSIDYSRLQAPNLSALKFRQFRGDRFTTALPFPDLIRGDIPVLNLTNQSFHDLTVKGSNLQDVLSVKTDYQVDAAPNSNSDTVDILFYNSGTSTVDVPADSTLGVTVPLSQITQNALRALETFTVFKERNARIKNSDTFYNGFIEAQFGTNPNVHNPRGVYLGGFYQDFALSSVTQLSESTESSPLGQKAGQGVSNGNGTICNDFYCNDFGWIQIYMSIVPDVYYTQGKPRMFSKKTQLDMYFPLFNNLEPQAILNKELYISGNSSTDEDVYAFEDRYSEYKSRPNRVSGLMALSHSIADYDASRLIARRFTSTPVLNNKFVYMVPENIDMNVFSVVNEPPFDFSCGISVRRVAPMPYTAVPGSLSSNIHA